ncbi:MULTISPECIES: hypothetical protein [Campylobacter]|uniref:Uncharacterized protein n=1 Tax=Campylobacter porcelli TaxID=1660073 RepID=A0ABU7M5F4_9BACT|nr:MULTISPECIES: hypothetical protein [unclassified Campylobacter]MCR8679262.1 hypothetical protein [Campylobacter sp. RM19072]MCR8696678.1 hypothetical protein [Campylobacter sp. RM19073]MEE3744954.1 hypothetical protein [Campylobacter sp. CX2-4855-23]MEE3776717.1 hypothetical protein [Campylobacter sp. CX2-4080-23]
MRKIAILCLISVALNAIIFHKPKTKEQKEGYRYGKTMRMLGMEKWECNKFKNIDDIKFEWCEYGWIDKSEEIDARKERD